MIYPIFYLLKGHKSMQRHFGTLDICGAPFGLEMRQDCAAFVVCQTCMKAKGLCR